MMAAGSGAMSACWFRRSRPDSEKNRIVSRFESYGSELCGSIFMQRWKNFPCVFQLKAGAASGGAASPAGATADALGVLSNRRHFVECVCVCFEGKPPVFNLHSSRNSGALQV